MCKKGNFIVIGQLPPPHHGTNVMTSIFLAALRNLGISYSFVSKEFSVRISEVGRFKFTKILRFVKFLYRLKKQLSLTKSKTLLYFVASGGVGLLADSIALFFAKKMRAKYILYIHGMGYSSKSKNVIEKILIKNVFSEAEACITLSEIMKSDIEGFCRGNIYILRNCISQEDQQLIEKVKGRYGSFRASGIDRKFRVLFLSNLLESKGVWTLVQAAKILKNENVEFLMIGDWRDKKFKEKVIRFINQSKLEGKFVFTGPLYGLEKFEKMANSDIFVFPSHHPPEAFSLVLLEAMAMGLPVVATKVGSLSEIVGERNGILIPPKDPLALAEAVKQLISDQRKLTEMRANSYQVFREKYTFEVYTANLNNILKNLHLSQEC